MDMIQIEYSSCTNCVFKISYEKRAQREKYPYNTHLPYVSLLLDEGAITRSNHIKYVGVIWFVFRVLPIPTD
jgi:hypothetical protein